MIVATTSPFLLSSLLLAAGAPLPQVTFDADSVPGETSSDSWTSANGMTDVSSFSVGLFTADQSNLQVLAGSPNYDTDQVSAASVNGNRDASINSVRVVYPKGSFDLGHSSAPVGGAEFYAHPMDLTRAQNVTLEYEVYFPVDFDFAHGGKLPGLYRGKEGCSGSDSADGCFSTRMMWRHDGLGELYLYAPRTKQTRSLCSTPPMSVCNEEEGMSIGRGAWTFARGEWTRIRQDIWLNAARKNDGGFNIWINDHLALIGNDVYYRNSPRKNPSRGSPNFASRWSDELHGRDDGDENDAPSPTNEPADDPAPVDEPAPDDPVQDDPAPIDNPAPVDDPPPDDQPSEAPDPAPMTPVAAPFPPVTVTLPAHIVTVTVPAPTRTVTAVPHPHVIIVPGSRIPNSAHDTSRHQTHTVVQPYRPTRSQLPFQARPKATPVRLVGFRGIHFSTFFGGHSQYWASPKDQQAYFRRFRMTINH